MSCLRVPLLLVMLFVLFSLTIPTLAKADEEEQFYGPFTLPNGVPFAVRLTYSEDGRCILSIAAMRVDEGGKVLDAFWSAVTLPVTLCARMEQERRLSPLPDPSPFRYRS